MFAYFLKHLHYTQENLFETCFELFQKLVTTEDYNKIKYKKIIQVFFCNDFKIPCEYCMKSEYSNIMSLKSTDLQLNERISLLFVSIDISRI